MVYVSVMFFCISFFFVRIRDGREGLGPPEKKEKIILKIDGNLAILTGS